MRRNLFPDPIPRTHIQMHFCKDPATCSEGCIGSTNWPEFNHLNEILERENVNVIFVREGIDRSPE